MFKRGAWAIGLLGILIWLTGCGKNNPVVARIGKTDKIRWAELRDDFAKKRKAPEAGEAAAGEYLKHLESMVQRRIKLAEANRLGLDADSLVEARGKLRMQNAILTRFYQKEIVDPVVKETDIRDYYAKTGKDVLVRSIFLRMPPDADQGLQDSVLAKANSVYDRIRKGESFSELARQFSDDEKSSLNGGLLGVLSYNRGNDPLLNAAFSLKTGEVSKPVKNNSGFNILRAEEIRPRERKPLAEARDDIRNQLIREKRPDMQKRAQAYEDKLKAKGRLTWDEQALDTLVSFFRDSKQLYQEQLISALKGLPADVQERTLITSRLETLRIADLPKRVESISGMMGIPAGQKQTWKNYVERWMMTDLLIERARKAGMERDPEVVSAVKQTREEAMLNLLNRKVIYAGAEPDSAAVLAHYEALKDSLYCTPEAVRIQEAMVNDRALAERIARLTAKRADLARYPAEHTIRPGMKAKNGIFEPFVKGQWDEIGELAFRLKPGQTGGPLLLKNNAWSVFKVITRMPKKIKPFDQVQWRVKRDLTRLNETRQEKAWLDARMLELNVRVEDKVLEGMVHAK